MAHIEQIVFFDGTCNFCNKTVDLLYRRKKHNRLFFASLQSEFAAEFLPANAIDLSNLDTIYYYRDGRLFERSGAVLRLSRELKGLSPALQIFLLIPSFFRDFFYNLIAKNRYKIFGKKDSCRIATEEERASFLETKEDFSVHSYSGLEEFKEQMRQRQQRKKAR